MNIEAKLDAIDDRFRKGSKQNDAARYIVRKNHIIPTNERKAICQEIPISVKSLQGLFTELRKMGLYPPQETPESSYQSPPIDHEPIAPEMSTGPKKKKTEKFPRPPTDKGYSLSIDPALIGRFRRGRNLLDSELDSEEKMFAHELRAIRLEEIFLKRRLRVAKLQKEIDKGDKEYATKEDFEALRNSINNLASLLSGELPPKIEAEDDEGEDISDLDEEIIE